MNWLGPTGPRPHAHLVCLAVTQLTSPFDLILAQELLDVANLAVYNLILIHLGPLIEVRALRSRPVR